MAEATLVLDTRRIADTAREEHANTARDIQRHHVIRKVKWHHQTLKNLTRYDYHH